MNPADNYPLNRDFYEGFTAIVWYVTQVTTAKRSTKVRSRRRIHPLSKTNPKSTESMPLLVSSFCLSSRGQISVVGVAPHQSPLPPVCKTVIPTFCATTYFHKFERNFAYKLNF